MDIDLLSKIVKELILDNDEVALPGIGSFVAEIVPSVFSDKGYTINPPYRRLSFRQKEAANENLLIEFYAKCNNLDVPTASRIVREFLEEMKHVLESKKSIIFPGLGKLRATRENYFFFVADEDLDIYPEGFGLEPISLKTHEETPAEVSATMAALRSILNPEVDNTEITVPETETGKANAAAGNNADSKDSSTMDNDMEQNPGSGVASSPDGDTSKETDSSTENVTGSDNVEPEPQHHAHADDAFEPDSVDKRSNTSATSAIAENSDDQVSGINADFADGIDSPDINEETKADATSESESHNEAGNKTPDVSPAHNESIAKGIESEQIADTAPSTGTATETVSAIDSGAAVKVSAGAETSAEASTAATVQDTESKGTVSQNKATGSRRNGWRIVKWTVITLLLITITALAAFIILAHIAPDFIDSILYTPEELEILNL